CEINPVYEFTNKRKICNACFIRWFQKKFLYTIRKFKMIEKGDIIEFKKGNSTENMKNKKFFIPFKTGSFEGRKFSVSQTLGTQKVCDFRDVVLDDLLKLYSGKGIVKIVKIRSASPHSLITTNRRSARFSEGEIVNVENSMSSANFINNSDNYRAKRDNFPQKIAVSSTTDSEADEIIHVLIKGNANELKNGAVEKLDGKIIIKPLYLFLDKEVLLYVKLKKLNFRKTEKKTDKLSLFIDELEKKHPEVKQSIIGSYGELFG
ncbi:MAG: hypothetical protein WC584_05265, partial [Candidatus Pacearchaeota archaeon]